ncbi:hypothetical protein Q5P01_022013 [Channa striata]|uniref:Uncharacterized protein n=1 Tax=Channa striata TaxID=64152 RepID=A0AA88IWC3_CHASR|nr:hypothetical protein Q5P01_022013 [Channa striata]
MAAGSQPYDLEVGGRVGKKMDGQGVGVMARVLLSEAGLGTWRATLSNSGDEEEKEAAGGQGGFASFSLRPSVSPSAPPIFSYKGQRAGLKLTLFIVAERVPVWACCYRGGAFLFSWCSTLRGKLNETLRKRSARKPAERGLER